MKQSLKLEIGTKFGSWTVISDVINKKNNITHWNCKCSCGTIQYIPLNNLMNGSSKQCKKCSLIKIGKEKRKGVGLLSGDHWSQIKLKLKKQNPKFNIRIEEAWEQFQKQKGKCYLSSRNIFLSGYPFDKKVTNAIFVIDNGTGYWVHKDVSKLLNNISFMELIDISNEITKTHKR